MVRPRVARGFRRSGVSGLASMYPVSDWSLLCSGPSWISARVRSHYRTGLNGSFGSPVFASAGNGLCQGAGRWNAAKLHLEPRLHHVDERPGVGVTNVPTRICGAAFNRSLDRIEFGDPPLPRFAGHNMKPPTPGASDHLL